MKFSFRDVFGFAACTAIAVNAAQRAGEAIEHMFAYGSKKVTKKKATKKKK